MIIAEFRGPKARYHYSTTTEFSRIHDDREMGFLGLGSVPTIIGVTGPTKAGKTMIANYLVAEHSFRYESLSGLLRERAAALGITSPTWEHMRDLALRWRRDGNAILLSTLFVRLGRAGVFESKRPIVIDGILHPAEAISLLDRPGTSLVAINAERALRYQLWEQWAGSEKIPSRQEFERRDRWEMGEDIDDGNRVAEAPNVEKCLHLAQVTFSFDGTAQVFREVDRYIRRLRVNDH
jgi:hypothetical protein